MGCFLEVSSGVPQDSIYGPLLFILYDLVSTLAWTVSIQLKLSFQIFLRIGRFTCPSPFSLLGNEIHDCLWSMICVLWWTGS